MTQNEYKFATDFIQNLNSQVEFWKSKYEALEDKYEKLQELYKNQIMSDLKNIKLQIEHLNKNMELSDHKNEGENKENEVKENDNEPAPFFSQEQCSRNPHCINPHKHHRGKCTIPKVNKGIRKQNKQRERVRTTSSTTNSIAPDEYTLGLIKLTNGYVRSFKNALKTYTMDTNSKFASQIAQICTMAKKKIQRDKIFQLMHGIFIYDTTTIYDHEGNKLWSRLSTRKERADAGHSSVHSSVTELEGDENEDIFNIDIEPNIEPNIEPID